MQNNEIIIDVGLEADELTLYGLRSPQGWLFSRHLILQSALRLYEVSTAPRRQVVTTWSAALGLLDHYPWQHLLPVDVHPEFRGMVLDAVLERFSSDVEKNPRRLADWTKLCMRQFPALSAHRG